MIVKNILQLALQDKKMYFQIVLLDIAVIESYWQLMLIINGYFDKKRDKRAKLNFPIFFFSRFNEHTNKSSKY